MDELQLSILLKNLNQLTPQQLNQLPPHQINQIRELAQLSQLLTPAQIAQFAQKQQQQKSQPNVIPNTPPNVPQKNLQQIQQAELLRLQAQQQQTLQQQQANQIPLTPQQLVHQQLSQNMNFSSGFPPTLVPPQNLANLYAYGYVQTPISSNANGPVNLETKYKQLLAVIEEMSKDIKSTYSGSKNSGERFKRLIVQAKLLIRECLNDINQK